MVYAGCRLYESISLYKLCMGSIVASAWTQELVFSPVAKWIL
jgi:hypothetical protein